MNSLRGNLSILFELYVDTNNKLNLKVGTSILEVGSIIKDTWHVVTMTFDTTSIKVYLDNNTVKTVSSVINLQDCLTYIGCQISSNSCINHLIGKVSLLAFTPTVSTSQEVSRIHANGLLVNIKSYYDKLGRLESKVIRHDDKVLSKGYYYKETTETSNRILKEEDYQGNVSEYTYDSMGNITSIQTINPTTNTVTESKTYTYDDLNRLVGSTDIVAGTSKTYTYGPNNNILTKDGLTYTYSSVYKDRLDRIGDKVITYSSTNPLLPIDYDNKGFTYTNNQISQVSDGSNTYQYEYNHQGLRIGKIVSGSYEEEYILQGDRVSILKRIENSQEKMLSFVYDESNMLVGLTYEGNQYFYDRTITGDIRSIIDIDGNIKVSYSYDDFGVPTITSDTSLIGESLKELNPYMYKGYFYDKETGWFYLQSRYYNPVWGRFITPDDVSYLDPAYVNGLNLYAYCNNNPIMYYDPSGHIVISTIIISAIIGFVVGGVTSAITQGLDKGWDNINIWQVLLDATIGGISGALGASGINRVVSMIAGGVLGAAGSVGGDLITSGGDWSQVNVGKAILMGAIGVGLGRWTGAGTQNAKAMVKTINVGQSWGSKAFLTSAKEVALRPNSGLTLQTMYMNMAKAINRYTIQGISKVSFGTLLSTAFGNSIGW